MFLLEYAWAMLSNNFQNLALKLKEFAKRVAGKSMLTATSKLLGAANTADVGVSFDGT